MNGHGLDCEIDMGVHIGNIVELGAMSDVEYNMEPRDCIESTNGWPGWFIDPLYQLIHPVVRSAPKINSRFR